MASEDSILKALLGGGGAASTSGSADVNAFNRTLRENDYWSKAGNMIGGVKFDDKTWSPEKTLAASAGQAFLSTILDSIGQSQQRKQTELMAQVLPELYRNPEEFVAPEGVDSMAVNALKMAAIQKEVERKAAREERKASTIDQIRQQFFSQRPDLAMRELGIEDIAPPADTETLTSSMTDLGPDLGVPSVDSIANQVFTQKRRAGVPAAQAEVTARETADALRKRSKLLIDSKLKDNSDVISGLEKLVQKGEEGINKAGNTGSNIASKYESFISTFAPWSTPEADSQAAGDQALRETQNLAAISNRIKGSGALTNMESEKLFALGMGPDKPKAVNEMILKNYKLALEAAKEHQSFLSYFADKTGGNPEMGQQLWDIYKEKNPIAVFDEKGNAIPNKNRKPWQQFDFPSAYKSFITGEDKGSMSKIEFAKMAKEKGMSKDEARAAWAAQGGQ